jgi:hypothetical protein
MIDVTRRITDGIVVEAIPRPAEATGSLTFCAAAAALILSAIQQAHANDKPRHGPG